MYIVIIKRKTLVTLKKLKNIWNILFILYSSHFFSMPHILKSINTKLDRYRIRRGQRARHRENIQFPE